MDIPAETGSGISRRSSEQVQNHRGDTRARRCENAHLRFFMLRSLQKMMREVSCGVLRVIPTPLHVQIVFPLTENKFFAPLRKAFYMLTRSWEIAFAYQFVVVGALNQSGVLLELDDEIRSERMPTNT
jgi:hypothetical protein